MTPETDTFTTFTAQALAQVLDFALVLLTMFVTWASGEAIAWLRARRKKDGEDYLNDLGQRVVKSAEIVVARNMGTIVKRAKAAASDGKLTADEAKKLLDDSTNDVIAYVGKQAVADAERTLQPEAFRAFVQSAIEAAVADWKESKKS